MTCISTHIVQWHVNTLYPVVTPLSHLTSANWAEGISCRRQEMANTSRYPELSDKRFGPRLGIIFHVLICTVIVQRSTRQTEVWAYKGVAEAEAEAEQKPINDSELRRDEANNNRKGRHTRICTGTYILDVLCILVSDLFHLSRLRLKMEGLRCRKYGWDRFNSVMSEIVLHWLQ